MTEAAEAAGGAGRASTKDDAFQAVVEAAQLARRCAGYWQDRRDQAAGWAVHYAVDVDVIALYSRPAMKSGYAGIFSALDKSSGRDASSARDCLAELLGRYALLQLSGLGDGSTESPGALILIPPHDDEYDRMRLAVAQQALEQVAVAVADLPAVVDEITQDRPTDHTGALAEAVDQLVGRFGHVIEAFDGQSGPVRQLTRLAALSRRLVNLNHAAPYRRERLDQRLLPSVDGRDAPDRDAYFDLVRTWRGRLERHQPRNKPAYALMGDAMALATLQMVNQRAAASRQRLVLVTGSRYLFAAAAGVELEVGGRCLRFDHAFLRHPQAFIGAKNFFERDAPGQAAGDKHRSRLRIVDWLNLFFPKVLQQTRPADLPEGEADSMSHDASVVVDHAQLDAIIRRDDQWLNKTLGQLARENYRRLTHREFPDGLLDDFALQIAQIATDIGLSTEESRPSLSRAQRFVAELNARLGSGYSVADLQEELTSRIEETVIKLYLETGELGVMQLIANGDPVRGVPALRFDGDYQAAQAQSELLCQTLWRDNARAFDLGAAYAALDSDGDPEHYHAHLIHAQVYAARGHWFATRTLSRLALRVSDRIPADQQRGRRGREAAYLMAVAERRLAQKAEDLQRAREALDLAQRKETPDNPRVDPRFRAEAMAVQAAALQFDRFHAGQPSAYPLDDLLRQADGILGALSPEDPESVQSWACRQVTTNLLVIALLAEIDGLARPDAAQRVALQGFIAGFRARHLAPDAPPHSSQLVFGDGLSSFVYDVAVATFIDDAPRRAAALARLSADTPLGAGAPPFEQARKALFLRHVGLARRP